MVIGELEKPIAEGSRISSACTCFIHIRLPDREGRGV